MKWLLKLKAWFFDEEPKDFERPYISLDAPTYKRLDIWNPAGNLTQQYHRVNAKILYDAGIYRLQYESIPLKTINTVNDKILSVERVKTGYIIGTNSGIRYTLIK